MSHRILVIASGCDLPRVHARGSNEADILREAIGEITPRVAAAGQPSACAPGGGPLPREGAPVRARWQFRGGGSRRAVFASGLGLRDRHRRSAPRRRSSRLTRRAKPGDERERADVRTHRVRQVDPERPRLPFWSPGSRMDRLRPMRSCDRRGPAPARPGDHKRIGMASRLMSTTVARAEYVARMKPPSACAIPGTVLHLPRRRDRARRRRPERDHGDPHGQPQPVLPRLS